MPLSAEIAAPMPTRAPPGPPWLGRLGTLAALGTLLSACTTGPLTSTPPVSPVVVGAPAAPSLPPAPAPTPAPPPVEAPPTPETLAREATQSLLRFHDRVRDLPPAEVAREITRLEARLLVGGPASSPPPAAALPASAAASGPALPRDLGNAPAPAQHSLELALLLAQQRQNGDLARALSLLEPLQRPAAPAATQPLARLLHTRLAEQRRLEELLERQTQTVRELQRRADQLAAQLEALRAIERSLNTRPAVPAVPQASPR